MELEDEREFQATREKLGSLEARYQSVSQDPGDDAHIQELTLRSLKRMINQMKEEIARYESRRSPRGPIGCRTGKDLKAVCVRRTTSPQATRLDIGQSGTLLDHPAGWIIWVIDVFHLPKLRCPMPRTARTSLGS